MVDVCVVVFGGVDKLVVNVGVVYLVLFIDIIVEDFDWVIVINFCGVWLCIKYVVLWMIECGGGVIVNLLLLVGQVVVGGIGVYGMLKVGIIQFSCIIVVELCLLGICFNMLLFVFVDILMQQIVMVMFDGVLGVGGVCLMIVWLQGCMVVLEEMVGIVVFLLFDDVLMIIGIIQIVDGGMIVVL